MKHPSENQPQEVIAGLVERVTYHNVENGFCVLLAKARGHRDVVTVVGHAPTIAAGEWITVPALSWGEGHGSTAVCADRPRRTFDGREVTYGFGELDMLVPASAATIHKSQGSKYPAVIIPLLTQHYAMPQ